MDASFIIVNYKSTDLLKKCLFSLHEKAGSLEYETIIANNDKDPLNEIVGENILVIERGTNDGFGRACNDAAAHAKSEILFFLNPDTEFLSGNIAEFLNVLQEPKIGIASPFLVNPDGSMQAWSYGSKINLWQIIKNNLWTSKVSPEKPPKDLCPTSWVSGAALAIKSSLFKKIGGFDDNFFMYFEDVDLCHQAEKLGFQTVVSPKMCLLHHGGASKTTTQEQKKQYYASQDHYFRKNLPFWQSIALRILRTIALAAESILL